MAVSSQFHISEMEMEVVGGVSGQNPKLFSQLQPVPSLLSFGIFLLTTNDLWFGLSLGKLEIRRLKAPSLGATTSGHRLWLLREWSGSFSDETNQNKTIELALAKSLSLLLGPVIVSNTATHPPL